MSPKHKSRFRFSHRTLLIAVTGLAILFASFGNRARRDLRERNCVSEIQRLGGRFDRRHAALLAGAGWASRIISFMCFEDLTRVTGVSLNGTNVQDEDMAMLVSLPGLEGLDISNTGITDAGLAPLAALRHLGYVNADQTRLTESGVAKLKSLRPSIVVEWK